MISIVAPAFNEEPSLPVLCAEVTKVMEAQGCKFEIVIGENGSSDNSLAILRELHAKDPRVNYVGLSRNFGSQGGLVAGLEYCRGDVVITMDADLQHPPAVIPRLLDAWEAGYDIVNTYRENKTHSGWLRLALNNFYFWMMREFAGISLESRQSDFRLFDRRALNALLSLPERYKFLRGLTHWIGFDQTSIGYVADKRLAGATKYKVLDLIGMAVRGVTSFSIVPLRFFSLVGFLVSLGAMSYGFIILVSALIGQTMPTGFASLAVGVFFLGGIQLIGIGVLGEYVGHIFDEARRRPVYLVRETSLATGPAVSASPSAAREPRRN